MIDALEPLLAQLRELDARYLRLVGVGTPPSQSVLGRRIAPALKATYGRLKSADRHQLAGLVDDAMNRLDRLGLAGAVPLSEHLTWIGRALVRSEPNISGLSGASAKESYGILRGKEARTPVASTLAELLVVLSRGHDRWSPSLEAMAGTLKELPEVTSASVRLVSFPTAELVLGHVDGPEHVGNAIIEDPRLLLYHLASQRLLQRRFVHRSTVVRSKKSVRAAVRFYLLDGSTSMGGARARMRDAILIAELASLVSRLERPGEKIRSLLYYRYFNSETEVTTKVKSIGEALNAIEDVLSSFRGGGTDIEGALIDSLELIDRERDNDIELSRAQIIVVSDGDAVFDPALIASVQERLQIPIRVSVIALGGENAGLRELASTQKSAGIRVLYHHVGDDELKGLEKDSHTEEAWPNFEFAEFTPEKIDHVLEDLESISEGNIVPADDPELMLAAMDEVDLAIDDLCEGRRAKLELAQRDMRSLARRFDRLFPEPRQAAPSVADSMNDELTFAIDALTVVLEVLTLSSTESHTARADAISILERLLRERGLPPSRFLELAREYPQLVGQGIVAIRLAVGIT